MDKLNEEIQVARDNWTNFPWRNCTQDELLKKLRTTGTNFVDVDFPPVDRSIFDPKKGQGFDRKVHWRRPNEFMQPDPAKGIFEP